MFNLRRQTGKRDVKYTKAISETFTLFTVMFLNALTILFTYQKLNFTLRKAISHLKIMVLFEI